VFGVMTVLRLNMTLPGLDPERHSTMYQAALDMATFADERGFTAVTTDEHHGADDGWMPATLVFTGMLVARTRRVAVSVQALLLPLHDPVRVAEDLAVLDLASGGRVVVTLGLGYRPEEYAAHGKPWAERGRLMDEAVATLLAAWTGEPFERHGARVRVTPLPRSRPHPPILIGGSARPAARRAARFGLPFAPPAHLPELEDHYRELCAANGTPPIVVSPPPDLALVFVAEDPDRAWRDVGQHFLHEATTYAGWQTPDIRSSVYSHATTVDELRAEGIYQILTPAECRARVAAQGDDALVILHPLCGGLPVDAAWECLHLYADEVLGSVGAPGSGAADG
jgi:alkanesulfonate monooxygenase SsuD/methylene tetrahydromethanopterin reductase-like flavin-dependent oxidoreductase (luciferase family)